jgi:hypothetical protein
MSDNKRVLIDPALSKEKVRRKPGHGGQSYQFADFAVKYYVIARRAFFFKPYTPPSANLFHHAVEYLLKYAWLERRLSDHYPSGRKLPETEEEKQEYVGVMDDLQQEMSSAFGHDLPKLWEAFKQLTADASLVRFDDVIRELQKWERIRYPWFPQAAQSHRLLLRKADRAAIAQSAPPTDDYILCLEDMDELYSVALVAVQLNPEWLRQSYLWDDEAMEAYQRENYHRLF